MEYRVNNELQSRPFRKALIIIACASAGVVLFWASFGRHGAPRLHASEVAACAGQTILLDRYGNLWAWKNNPQGLPILTGRPARVGDDSNWRAVAVGWETVAGVKHDGSLWAWGSGAQALWGDTNLVLGKKLAQVGIDRDWSSVAAGFNSFVALKKDGTLWSWGSNQYGQLGDGTGAGSKSTNAGSSLPIQITRDTNWVMIAARVFRSVALKSDGSLWSWGWNVYGEVGDGTYRTRYAPVQIGSDNDWKSVFVANDHTLAIKKDGSLWVWGENREGQFGDETRIRRNYPNRVGTENDWRMAAGGRDHTLAIKKDGSLWAWGLNSIGQLGDGTRTSRLRPVRIGRSRDWIAIAAGEHHSVGIKKDGSVYLWGQTNQRKEMPAVTWLRRVGSKIGLKIPPRRLGVVRPGKIVENQ